MATWGLAAFIMGMNRYVLNISSWAGTVPWATHYHGTVVGESDPRISIMRDGKWFDAEGNEYPDRAEWNVYAHWTEAQNERWAANHYEDHGPTQFATEQDVMEAAIKRFTGEWETRWWEPDIPKTEPGDELYYGYVPMEDDDFRDFRGSDRYGTLLVKIEEETK